MKVVGAAAADDSEIGRLGEFGAVGSGIDTKLGDALDRRKEIVRRAALARSLCRYAIQRERPWRWATGRRW